MQAQILSNRYKILQKFGEGGFAETFLAEDLHLPTKPRCVVKRLRPPTADAESWQLARRLFEQEAEILYRLGNHPKIPNLVAHFEENGEFFLVQELIEGWTLAQEFANKKNYEEKEVVDIIWQILETLTFVHSQNVIHRDIKPTNLIRRQSDGSIFLIDFGAVKQVSINPLNQNPTFKSTIAIGSNGYMPSEQTVGKPRFASDLYAAGLVAIQAATGINPLNLAQNAATSEFVWSHKAKLGNDFGNFISRLVRYDFRQRFQSANEAFSALKMIASISGFHRKTAMPVKVNQPIQPIQVSPIVRQPAREILAPTIAPTVAVSPNLQKTLVQPLPNNFQPLPENKSKGSIKDNDFALVVGVVAAVFGFFFLAGFMLYAVTANKSLKQNSNTTSATATDTNTAPTFQEAMNQANEAEAKEKKATTRREWEEIGSQYKRTQTILSSIGQTNPDYEKAQEKMKEYEQKSELAYLNAETAIENPTVIANSNTATYPTTVTTTNYPTTTTTTTYPRSTPTPAKPVVTMPGKQSAKTYLSYNYLNYDRLENKVVTPNDAIFTTSVEKQSDNKRDSGVVRINIEGGSYSSSRLAFKAPHGQRLSSGTYTNAQEYLWQSPTMYAVSFDKLSCFERGSHSFTINSIVYDELYANISYLDASFTINCDTRKLMGRIRYDARY